MAAETVDDLLTLARVDREALELELQVIDLVPAVTEISKRYGIEAANESSNTDRVDVVADPTRVHQIVRNLCTNAQRYGGRTIEVVVRTDAPHRCHALIRDNGQGINATDLDVIFEPFGRGSAGRASKTSVGLGLWLSRNLARAMDGELSYRRENGWTVFDLQLPAAQAPSRTVPEPRSRYLARA